MISDVFEEIVVPGLVKVAVKNLRLNGAVSETCAGLAQRVFVAEWGFKSVTVQCRLRNADPEQDLPRDVPAYYTWSASNGEDFLSQLAALVNYQQRFSSGSAHTICVWRVAGQK